MRVASAGEVLHGVLPASETSGLPWISADMGP